MTLLANTLLFEYLLHRYHASHLVHLIPDGVHPFIHRIESLIDRARTMRSMKSFEGNKELTASLV